MRFNPYGLFHDLANLRGEMNRLFGSLAEPYRSGRGGAGPLNLYETPEEYHVVLFAPGADREKFNISLTGDTLLVRGEVPAEARPEAPVHRNERKAGAFERTVELPGKVDGAGVSASFSDGLLTVRLSKAEDQKPRKIELKLS
jgi:HSP20 family protein